MGIFHRSHHFVALPLSALLLQVFFLPINIEAAPSPQDKCGIFCRAGQASVLNYDVGEYRYDFESEITTEVTLAKPESRRTKIKAEVVIVANSPCDLTLKVKNLAVNNDRGNNYEQVPNLNTFTGRFTLQSGIIGNICLDPEEPTWSANIKRAIISLLQNKALDGVSENDVIESDVSGRCPTKYAIVGNDYVKTKTLNSCLHREGGSSVLHGVPYEVNSKYNSVPDLASTQSCKQTLENGIYKTVECTELHKLEKFIKKTVGPNLQTNVVTKLTLTGSKKGTTRQVPSPNASKTTIFYDYSDHSDESRRTVAVQATKDNLERICSSIRPDGVTSEVPALLLDLKKSLGDADKDSLKQILGEIKSGSLCSAQASKLESMFLDTAAQAATDGTIGLLAELYAQGSLNKVTERYFYLYTTFADHPHVESLNALLPLITTQGVVSKRLLLAASGLAHQYCKTSNPSCADREEYAALVDRLAAVVRENALSTEEGKSDVAVAGLQALGNLDHLTDSAVAAITLALTGTDRIKTRALDAFRRDPCQTALKQKAQDVFVDANQPANLRVGAYLANLRCLTASDAPVIQRVLNDEKSFQVGGYIESHLKNVLKSSSPSSRQLQSAARLLNSKLSYPREIRKFSRHLESSIFNSDINLGYSAEGNVIFSKESFIPRQLSANVTFDIFGQSYNLLEVGLYLENFDHLQESVFGPHGKFPIDEQLTGRKIFNQVLKLRNKRETPGPVIHIDQQGLQAIQQQVNIPDHSGDAGIGDVYIRIFGTTVTAISLNSQRAPQTIKDLKEKVRTLVGGAIRTSQKDIEFIHPILLTSDEVIVPTTSGLAIASTLEANVVPSIDYSKDYKAPDGNGSPLDLKLRVGSNIAATVRGRHSVVGGPIETGIQVEGNLRTGGAVDILVFRDQNKFETKLSLPHEKIRAFDVSTNVVWVKRGLGRAESKGNFRATLQVQPGPATCEETLPLLRVLGLKLCTRANIQTDENIPFLLNGRQSFSASLEKTEPSMEGYQILMIKNKEGQNRNYELTLDTPGSTTNRKLVLDTHVEDDAEGTRKINVHLKTPNYSDVKIDYERTNTDELKGIKAKLTLPSTYVSVNGNIKRKTVGDEITYEPHLSFEVPIENTDYATKKSVLLAGKVVRTPGQKLSLDLSSQLPDLGITISPLDIVVKGTVEVKRNGPTNSRYQLEGIELGARSRDEADSEPHAVLTVNGHCERKDTEYNTDLKVKYGANLDHEVSIHKSVSRQPGNFALTTKVESTQFPTLNLDLTSNIARSSGSYKSSHSLTLGPDGRKVRLSSESNCRLESATSFDFNNELKFAYEPISYKSSIATHVKNVVGEEQVVGLKAACGREGQRDEFSLNFDRKAAQNNDFTLNVAIKNKRLNVDGEFNHKRTALTDSTHQSSGFTHSYQHESVLTQRSSSGASEDRLLTIVRLLKEQDALGVSINSQLTIRNGDSLSFTALAKNVATEVVTDVQVQYRNNKLASLEIKALKDASNVVFHTFLANQWKIDAQRELKDPNHAVTHVNAEILSTGRTVTLDVDRSKTGDVTKVEAELKWDASRDATQSLKIVSDNRLNFESSPNVNSKNKITLVGQTIELNLDAKFPSQITHGEHSVTFNLIAIDGRSYDIIYNNILDIEPSRRSSKAKVSVNTPELKQTEVSWNVESLNPNLQELVFDIKAEVAVVTGGASSQNIVANLAAANSDGQRSITAKLALGGDGIPENILIDSKLVIGPKSLRTENSFQVGTSVTGVELSGDLDEQNDVRIGNLKYTLTNLPLLKYQKIEGELSHKRRLGGPIQIYRKHQIKLDGRIALSYNYALSLLNDKLAAEAKVTSWDKQLLDLNLNGVVDTHKADVSGNVAVNQQNFVVKLYVDKENPLRLLQLRAEANEEGFSLKLENTKDATYTLTTNVKTQSKSVQLESSVTISQNERGFSVKVVRDQSDAKELKLHYVKTGDNLSYDGQLTYEDKSFKFDGTANKVAGGYEGKVNYEIQPANTDKGIVEFAVVIQDTHRKLSLKAGEAQHPLDLLSLEYTKVESAHNSNIDGTFSTDVATFFGKSKLSGSFKSECNHLEKAQNGEAGHEFVSTINYDAGSTGKGVLQVEFKLTDLEIHSVVQVSQDSKVVRKEFQVKKASDKEVPRTHKFRWVTKNDQSTYGITFDAVENQSPKSLDANLKIILGDETRDVVEVQVYGKIRKGNRGEGGVNINLPSTRQISVIVSKNAANGGEITVWLDKKRHADQKLTVGVEYGKLSTADGAQGYEYKATVRHPSLAKALTIKRKVVRFGQLIVHDSATELDLLDDPNNKIVILAKAAWTDESHSQLKTQLSVKSEGLGLLLQGEGEVTKEENSVVANLKYSYTNRDGQLNERNVEIAYSENHQSILVGEKQDPVLLLSRSVRDLGEHRRRRSVQNGNSNTVDVRYEIHLPGMRDTRVIDVHLHGSVPPHLNLKTLTTGSDKSYELSLGFPTEKQLLLGVYRQINQQRTSLAELSVALNTTQLLSVKARWDLVALQQVLKTASERFENTGDNLQSSSDVYIQGVAQDLQSVIQKLSDALPNLGPLQEHLRNELVEIKNEVNESPASETLRQAVNAIISTIEAASEPVQKLLECLHNFPEYLNQLKAKAPGLVKKYEKFLRSIKITVGKILKVTLQTARPIIREIQLLIAKIQERLGGNLNSGTQRAFTHVKTLTDNVYVKIVEFFLDNADDIGRYLEASSASPEIKEFGAKILRYAVAKLKGQTAEAQDIREEIAVKGRDAIQKLVGEILTVDIKHGVISALIPLPKPVNSLLDVSNAVRQAWPKGRLSLPYRNQLTGRFDILRQFFKDLVSANSLTAVTRVLRTNTPPHAAQAYIIGSQYFITFDGKLFHHEGHCQYLLLSDFVNKDLNIAIDFQTAQDGTVKKSIIVADKDETVVINPDFTVTSEGKSHITVEETDLLVKLTVEDHEAIVSCNKASDVCTVTIVNGYLFGRVRGLLGTYNNEQYDDLRTPAGQTTQDDEAFAASWKLNGQCTESSIAEHSPVPSEAARLCSSTFSSRWSPLRSCFRKSNPSEFEKICRNLSAEKGWTVQQAVCTAANAYEQTCRGTYFSHHSFCSH